MKLSRLEILSREDIDAIFAAAFHLLKYVGIRYQYRPALELLEENGCTVDYKTEIVKIPEGLVGDCLNYTPRQMRFCGREKVKDIRVVTGETNHMTVMWGGNPNLLTYPDNKYKPYTTEDIANIAKICDYLPLIEGVGLPREGGREYPEEVCSVYALEAHYDNTTKPVVDYQPHNWVEALASLDLARIVAGGEEEFRKRPIYSAHWCATDPLQWDSDGCKFFELCANWGVPTGLHSHPVIGANSPSSIAGVLAQDLAAVLSGIVLLQLINKGLPIWLASVTAPVLDMKSAQFWYRVSSTLPILCIAKIQLYRQLRLPSSGGGISLGNESKILDAQWGLEGMLTFVPQLAGAEMMSCEGWVGKGQGVSHEGLLISHEAMKSILRIIEGVEVSPEALALDLFEKEGPGGKFIGYRHTLKWYLKEHIPPELFDKEVWQKWDEMGRRDIVDRAHEKVVEILSTHEVEPLSKDILDEIHAYQIDYRKKVETGILVPGKPPV
jgi:trimethylamine--corrinoid protein Co-methyltransferase